MENIINKEFIESEKSEIYEKFKFTEIVDELSIFNKINKNHIRYFVIKYGIDTTRELLKEIKLNNFENLESKELNKLKKYGIYPEQIKFEIENMQLKDTFDFVLKRHNYISLLNKENRKDLLFLAKVISEIYGYSELRTKLEIYKTSVFCDNLFKSNRIKI